MRNKFLDLCHLQNIARHIKVFRNVFRDLWFASFERVMASRGADPC